MDVGLLLSRHPGSKAENETLLNHRVASPSLRWNSGARRGGVMGHGSCKVHVLQLVCQGITPDNGPRKRRGSLPFSCHFQFLAELFDMNFESQTRTQNTDHQESGRNIICYMIHFSRKVSYSPLEHSELESCCRARGIWEGKGRGEFRRVCSITMRRGMQTNPT